jgi:hypothetical protein
MALRRFGSVRKRDASDIQHLKSEHPAITEARPLFPSRVVKVEDSPRLLVSGHNNRKIGKKVMKGEWMGMPIYTLTLAERTTCPRQCFMFERCYGDAMHWARRHQHGPELERRLTQEVAAKAAEHPKGFVVRLHVLGDFYSAAYVLHWMDLLREHKELRVWGYTARSLRYDPAIALMIEWMNDLFYERCNIRFSAKLPYPGGATVFPSLEAARQQSVVVCPAETQASECCATCGLCWSKNAREKTIAFIEHGGVKKK